MEPLRVQEDRMEPLILTLSAWDGLPLRVRVWDGGDRAPAVLCLPGLVRTGGDFDAVAPVWAAGRRVVSLDYMGRGGSGRSRDVNRYAPEACLRDVLDVCAAPGGKATAMASTGAFVIAADLQAHRAALVADNVKRLGYRLPVVIADGTAPPFTGATFDRVLIDAPCSGLGALRRRPDARWRITSTDIDDLVAIQQRLLDAACTLVKPGGVLVYSVCTVTAAESIDHPIPTGFDAITDVLPDPWSRFAHGFRILPQDADTDGMVIIRYRRTT